MEACVCVGGVVIDRRVGLFIVMRPFGFAKRANHMLNTSETSTWLACSFKVAKVRITQGKHNYAQSASTVEPRCILKKDQTDNSVRDAEIGSPLGVGTPSWVMFQRALFQIQNPSTLELIVLPCPLTLFSAVLRLGAFRIPA